MGVSRRKVYVETYGCQMNVSDSELMLGILSKEGYTAVEAPDEADVILINTCAVREHAEQRIIGRLGDLYQFKQRNPRLILGVCGCMAQHIGEQIIARAPYVDLVMGPDVYRQLPEAIERIETDELYVSLSLDKTEHYDGVVPVRQEGVRAWLTIMRGCDKFCTFCIVPYVRGRERSLPMEEVLRQVHRVVDQGYQEVILLGQTVNSYRDGDRDFGDLLQAVAEVAGIRRIRFTSPHPSDFAPSILDVIASNDKICKQIHLPLQSGSTSVLKAMRRSYTAEEFAALIEQIRTRIPQIALGTDIIVGFSGETEQDFLATCQMMEDIRFDTAFMFKYSPRKGTIADRKLADDVPEDEKTRRLQTIIDIQQQITRESNQAMIGHTVEVLVEGESRRDPEKMFGKTDDFRTTILPGGNHRIGDLVQVKIVDSTGHTLLGETSHARSNCGDCPMP